MTTTPAAGSRIKAANTPAPYLLSAACSSNLVTSSGTAADITGATITFTTVNANAVVLVSGVFDITATTSANAAALGTCVVDGTTQSGQAISVLITTNKRDTVAQNWNVSLPTAGSHTIKFQGACSGATATFSATHTTLTALVLDW